MVVYSIFKEIIEKNEYYGDFRDIENVYIVIQMITNYRRQRTTDEE